MSKHPDLDNPAVMADLLKVGTDAAASWAIARADGVMSARQVVAGIAETVVMHLLEEGLLIPAPDLALRLAGPVPRARRRVSDPEPFYVALALDSLGRERAVIRGAADQGVEEGAQYWNPSPGESFVLHSGLTVLPTDGYERFDDEVWRIYRPPIG